MLRFSPDGTCLALAQPGVWLWRTGEGPASVQKLVKPGTTIGAIAFSRDSRYLAAAVGALVPLWDLRSGKEVASLRHFWRPNYGIIIHCNAAASFSARTELPALHVNPGRNSQIDGQTERLSSRKD
jgi:hypothetical protein